jgi:hypothetical protein
VSDTRALPRNATRIHVNLPTAIDVEGSVIRAVRYAIGDQKAEVSIRLVDGEGDFVIVVKQPAATWWAHMPDSLAERLGDFDGSFVLRWHDDEPPAEVEE